MARRRCCSSTLTPEPASPAVGKSPKLRLRRASALKPPSSSLRPIAPLTSQRSRQERPPPATSKAPKEGKERNSSDPAGEPPNPQPPPRNSASQPPDPPSCISSPSYRQIGDRSSEPRWLPAGVEDQTAGARQEPEEPLFGAATPPQPQPRRPSYILALPYTKHTYLHDRQTPELRPTSRGPSGHRRRG